MPQEKPKKTLNDILFPEREAKDSLKKEVRSLVFFKAERDHLELKTRLENFLEKQKKEIQESHPDISVEAYMQKEAEAYMEWQKTNIFPREDDQTPSYKVWGQYEEAYIYLGYESQEYKALIGQIERFITDQEQKDTPSTKIGFGFNALHSQDLLESVSDGHNTERFTNSLYDVWQMKESAKKAEIEGHPFGSSINFHYPLSHQMEHIYEALNTIPYSSSPTPKLLRVDITQGFQRIDIDLIIPIMNKAREKNIHVEFTCMNHVITEDKHDVELYIFSITKLYEFLKNNSEYEYVIREKNKNYYTKKYEDFQQNKGMRWFGNKLKVLCDPIIFMEEPHKPYLDRKIIIKEK